MENLYSQSKKFILGFTVFLLLMIMAFLFVGTQKDVCLSFSEEPGYYDEAIELKILGNYGCKVYYTLDGSVPGADGNLYDPDKPITLSDATSNKNVYSMRTDTSTAFLTDMIAKHSPGVGDPGYTVPDYAIDKCNVVRASVFDAGGNCLDTITGVYFIGFQNKAGYDKIYTASIVTDPDNLFNYDTGIYVTGSSFENAKETIFGPDGEVDDSVLENRSWYWWTSNYSNRGQGWEREAFVSIFDEERNLVLSENCGIRIQGGGSRGMLPKSIGCYARQKYSGSYQFQTALFQEDIYLHKFVFFSGGDDNIFKLSDYLVNTMEKKLAFSTMDFIPCALFLDGEYWGMYYITENYNRDFISSHYQVEEDNVIMIKNGELTEGERQEGKLFEEMVAYIAGNDMTSEENYEKACSIIDVDSYIDYYAAQTYIARYGDWPGGNYAAWRTRKSEGTAYGDCRWRWMLFDVNSGALAVDMADADIFVSIPKSDVVFQSLYQNEEFRVKFAKRLLYIGREIFPEEKCEAFLDDYVQRMREPIAVGCRRFYNDARTEEFDRNVEEMRLFFRTRYDAIWNSLVNNMGEEWLEQNGIRK